MSDTNQEMKQEYNKRQSGKNDKSSSGPSFLRA